MINKFLGLSPLFLTIDKPTSQVLSLLLGEIVKAKIIDILPSGEVNLKIKGKLFSAMTDIPLQKGENAIFKVAELSSEKSYLKLQFIGYADKTSAKEDILIFNFKNSQLPKLIEELKSLIYTNQKLKNLSEINTASLQTLHLEILKSLPDNVKLLPKDMRLSLEKLLLQSLKLSGKGIHARIDEFINQLPEKIKDHPIVADIKKNSLINIEMILQTPIKSILHNTGVILEPKLMAIAQLFLNIIKGLDDPNLSPVKQESFKISQYIEATHSQQSLLQHKILSLKDDLKAGLLKLRQLLFDNSQIDKADIANLKATIGETSRPHPELISKISSLIKDIETFQILSKVTDSFYTFLPVIWQNLRDCNLSIRHGKRNAKGESYSCRINLELERLGKLSAVIMMLNREFIIFLKADNPDFQSILNKNIEGLYKSFKESKLNLKAVNFLKINESIEQIEELEFEKGLSTRV